MIFRKLNQHGFHVIELAIVLVVVGVVGLIGYKVFSQADKSDNAQGAQQDNEDGSSNESVKWAFNEKTLEWFTQTGTAPDCKDPFVFDNSPVDLSQILVIGMPGQYRGFNYKPHGGLRLANPDSGKIDIKMPMDATLVGLNRYYEGNPAEIQYLLTFESDCGIAFRFDHLFTLTPAFQAIAETTPEPKLDDTRSDPNLPFKRTTFKAGAVVATEIGHPATKNFGFDFGVYDYRERNEISKNKKWADIHNQFEGTEWFGVCWPNLLPGTDAAKAKELSLIVVNPQKPNIASDYCSYAPHTTLDVNNGQPTDG